MTENSTQSPAVPGNTGNPRVTVAFPFSKIEIRDPEPALAHLAALVRDLTEYVATLPLDLPAEQKDLADRLVQQAKQLASSLGAA